VKRNAALFDEQPALLEALLKYWKDLIANPQENVPTSTVHAAKYIARCFIIRCKSKPEVSISHLSFSFSCFLLKEMFAYRNRWVSCLIWRQSSRKNLRRI